MKERQPRHIGEDGLGTGEPREQQPFGGGVNKPELQPPRGPREPSAPRPRQMSGAEGIAEYDEPLYTDPSVYAERYFRVTHPHLSDAEVLAKVERIMNITAVREFMMDMQALDNEFRKDDPEYTTWFEDLAARGHDFGTSGG